MKNKTETTGKRFSKREAVTFELNEDKAAADKLSVHLREAGRPNDKGSYIIGQSFRERMDALASRAASFLREQGLPDASRIYRTRSEPDKWQADQPPLEEFKAFYLIDNYVCKKMGYEHDSPEGIAAQILVHHSRLWSSTVDETAEAAFKLGELWRLAIVYGITTPGQRKKAQLPRKPELASVINDVARQAGGPKELWPHFYSALEVAGLQPREIAINGKPGYRYDGGEIALSTFGNRLREARKKKPR